MCREKGVELTGAIEHQLHQHHAMWRRDQGHAQPPQGFPKLAAAPSRHPHHMQATGQGPLMLENAPQGVTCLHNQQVTWCCTLCCLIMLGHPQLEQKTAALIFPQSKPCNWSQAGVQFMIGVAARAMMMKLYSMHDAPVRLRLNCILLSREAVQPASDV